MIKILGKGNRKKSKQLQKENSNNSGLTKSLDDNINAFKNIFLKDETLIIREFENKQNKSIKCCVIFIDGMVNNEIVNENIIQPVMANDIHDDTNMLETLQTKVLVSNSISKTVDINEAVSLLLYGDTIFLIEGYDELLVIRSKGWMSRAITEPDSEKVVRGPREGFNESIIINLSLLRRKIKNSDLKFEFKELGTRTKTKCCISYINGIVSEKILKEVKERLNKINIDSILDSGYIQDFISDSPLSPFETVGSTERPDVVAGKLLEGRIAIFVDGSPFVLTVPHVFIEYFQSNEDYYNNYIFSSINRIIRIIGYFLTISIPAIYIALTTFHQEMIPTPLLLSISAARKGVPFPTIVACILMLFVFEVLREAGTRMPSAIGQTISIVGALVLGQAAVEARIVSAPIVIVVALTGITGLINIKMKASLIVVRVVFLILAGFIGMYGYFFGLIGLVLYLMDIRSFGVPFMLNIGQVDSNSIKDTAIRVPWWYMHLRPSIIATKDYVRHKTKNKRGLGANENT